MPPQNGHRGARASGFTRSARPQIVKMETQWSLKSAARRAGKSISDTSACACRVGDIVIFDMLGAAHLAALVPRKQPLVTLCAPSQVRITFDCLIVFS